VALTTESFFRWYIEQGCPTINPGYSWTPTASKVCEEAEVTLSSESDFDSYYSDCLNSARDTTPPNAHIGTATTQIVQSIEACYIATVGNFYEEHKVHRKVEVQHRRYLNPRRVGKKKLESTTDTVRWVDGGLLGLCGLGMLSLLRCWR
jgi:hypothetical protein